MMCQKCGKVIDKLWRLDFNNEDYQMLCRDCYDWYDAQADEEGDPNPDHERP